MKLISIKTKKRGAKISRSKRKKYEPNAIFLKKIELKIFIKNENVKKQDENHKEYNCFSHQKKEPYLPLPTSLFKNGTIQ